MLLPVGRLSCSRPALLSLLSVTEMLVGCKDERPVAEAPTPVRVQRIEMETATEGRAYTGVVRARYETDLGFRVAGKIAERLVNVRDRVDKDQPRARLDRTDYREVFVAIPESHLDDARASAAVIDLPTASQFGGSWRVT